MYQAAEETGVAIPRLETAETTERGVALGLPGAANPEESSLLFPAAMGGDGGRPSCTPDAGRPGPIPAPAAAPGPTRFTPAAAYNGGEKRPLPKEPEDGRRCCCWGGGCCNEPVLVDSTAAVAPKLPLLVGLLPRLPPGLLLLPPRLRPLLPMLTLAGRGPLPVPPLPPLTGEKRPLAGRDAAAADEGEALALPLPRRAALVGRLRVGKEGAEVEVEAAIRLLVTLLEPGGACRVMVLLLLMVVLAAVAARASRMAGPPVVERSVLESVAERATMEAGGRGRGFGGPLRE